MGKSALTWKWFHDIAPHEMQPLAGRLWWSFYESDASFENFVIRALAYVSQRPREEIQQLSPPERESQLLAILDREPYLLVLDGLERILIAYARMDAARLADDDLDQQTANYGRRSARPTRKRRPILHRPTSTAQKRRSHASATSCASWPISRSSRILVSTRLYPADLQTATGGEAPGSQSLLPARSG